MSKEIKHPGLYRARLACMCGRDVLDGKRPPPDNVQPMEWAMFNLLHAVEEIVSAMELQAKDVQGE